MLFTWVIVLMPIDDSVAFRLDESGWRAIGVKRFTLFGLVDSVFCIAAFALNRIVMKHPARPCWIAVSLSGLLLIINSLSSCLRFVITKPWM